MLVRALTLTNAKEELRQIHDILHGEMISAFIGDCRGKDFIGLKCPEKLLRHKCSVRSVRNLLMQRIFICSGSWRLETVLSEFLIARLLRCVVIKIKRKSFRSFVEESLLFREASIKHL